MIAFTAPIKKTAVLWEKSSILATWMQNRYKKGRSLQNINVSPTIDSAQWKELAASKTKTELYIECRAGNTVLWKIGNCKKNLGVIVESLRTRGLKDPLPKGIWSFMPTKFSIMLWRIITIR